MRTIAVGAILVGTLELLNTVAAFTAAGRGPGSVTTGMTLVIVAIVALLLLTSGIALLLRRQRAISHARVAALACLVVFSALAAIWPVLSIGSTLLGIAFPIAMLVFLLRQ